MIHCTHDPDSGAISGVFAPIITRPDNLSTEQFDALMIGIARGLGIAFDCESSPVRGKLEVMWTNILNSDINPEGKTGRFYLTYRPRLHPVESDSTPVPSLTEEQEAKLNRGIRSTVRFLRSHGFNTSDSGDGETREFYCDDPRPYVHIRVDVDDTNLVAEARRLQHLLEQAGVDFHVPNTRNCASNEEIAMILASVPSIEATYSPHNQNLGILSVFNVILPPDQPLSP